MALAYHRAHGLDAVVTRCSNNSEPYQFPEKAIQLFITNLIEGNTVPLYGDDRSIRDWLHVSDPCRGIELVLRGGKAGEIYHIGGGTEVSSHKHTGLLLDAVGTGWHRVEYVADRTGHDLRCSPGASKIREHLGYAPQVAFTDGLAGTVARHCERRSWWEPLKARAELG